MQIQLILLDYLLFFSFRSGIVITVLEIYFQKSNRSKKKWFGKQKHVASDSHPVDTATESTFPPPPPQQEVEEVMKLTNEQNGGTKDVSFMANVTADSVALAASEVVSVSVASRFAGKSEEIAVMRIQTAFRGYQVLVFE